MDGALVPQKERSRVGRAPISWVCNVKQLKLTTEFQPHSSTPGFCLTRSWFSPSRFLTGGHHCHSIEDTKRREEKRREDTKRREEPVSDPPERDRKEPRTSSREQPRRWSWLAAGGVGCSCQHGPLTCCVILGILLHVPERGLNQLISKAPSGSETSN